MKSDSEKIYDLEQKCKKLEFIITQIFEHFKPKVFEDDFTEFKEEIDEKIWRL